MFEFLIASGFITRHILSIRMMLKCENIMKIVKLGGNGGKINES
jgi:hypothetical protein